jgi:hypothetical protein
MKSALGAGFDCAVHSFYFLYLSLGELRVFFSFEDLKNRSFTWYINKLVIQQRKVFNNILNID